MDNKRRDDDPMTIKEVVFLLIIVVIIVVIYASLWRKVFNFWYLEKELLVKKYFSNVMHNGALTVLIIDAIILGLFVLGFIPRIAEPVANTTNMLLALISYLAVVILFTGSLPKEEEISSMETVLFLIIFISMSAVTYYLFVTFFANFI